MTRKVLIPDIQNLDIFKIPDSQVGIYILWNDNEAVYVGQSTNIHYRLSQHYNDGKKEFDSYSLIPKMKDDLDSAEKYYIMLLKPKYNKIVPDFVTINTLLGRVKGFSNYNINMKEVRKAIKDLNIPSFDFKGVDLYDKDKAGVIAHMIHCNVQGIEYSEPHFFVYRSQ